MSFLRRIQQWIHQYRNKDYRKKVQQNKKKTYLLSDYEETFSSDRAGVIRKKKGTLEPFSALLNTVEKTKQEYGSWFSVIGLVLLLLSGYIIFFSTFFQATPSRVQIVALDPSIDESLCYQAIEDLYYRNIFLTDSDTFLTAIKKYQKHVESIQLDYLYPNQIKIIVSPVPLAFRFSIGGVEKLWGITKNGVLIPQDRAGSGLMLLPALEMTSASLREHQFLDYKTVLTEDDIVVVEKIIEIMGRDLSDIHVAKLRYFLMEQELHMVLESGTVILLSLDSSLLKNQFLTLRSFVNAYRDTFLTGDATYVDARIVGKIFTCWHRETCRANLKQLYGGAY